MNPSRQIPFPRGYRLVGHSSQSYTTCPAGNWLLWLKWPRMRIYLVHDPRRSEGPTHAFLAISAPKFGLQASKKVSPHGVGCSHLLSEPFFQYWFGGSRVAEWGLEMVWGKTVWARARARQGKKGSVKILC